MATVLEANELLLRLHLSIRPFDHRWLAGLILYSLDDTDRHTVDFREIYEG